MSAKAYVLITVDTDDIWETLKRVRESQTTISAEAVTGPYDIVALIEADSMDKLAEVVTREILAVVGVERTLTSVVLEI